MVLPAITIYDIPTSHTCETKQTNKPCLTVLEDDDIISYLS